MPGDEAIKHIVLLIIENHAFDQMLGCFQEKYPELDGVRKWMSISIATKPERISLRWKLRRNSSPDTSRPSEWNSWLPLIGSLGKKATAWIFLLFDKVLPIGPEEEKTVERKQQIFRRLAFATRP
jgi:hypothetical protein